jgi:hypothetical protein
MHLHLSLKLREINYSNFIKVELINIYFVKVILTREMFIREINYSKFIKAELINRYFIKVILAHVKCFKG